MEVISESYTKAVHVVKWNAAFPRAGCTTKTKTFFVYGVGWKLEFKSSIWNNVERCYLNLEPVSKEKFRPFPISLYFQHKGDNNFLGSNIIKSTSKDIWTYDCASFRENYPHIPVTEPNILFILDFHEVAMDSGNRAITPKKRKSVQASGVHPCLENLSLDMNKLLSESPDADVQLTCEDLTIKAHKIILGARSEVFRTMMQSDMTESRNGVIEIVDMEPSVLKIFIRYLYTGILSEFTEDTIIPLYEAADKYQVDGLRKRSSRLLSKILSQENALEILAVADVYDDKDLKSQVFSYIVNRKILRNDENWRKFYSDYPELAIELLNYHVFSSS